MVRTLFSITAKANLCLKQINEWLIADKLSLSLDKTCYTVFFFEYYTIGHLTIKIDGVVIDIKRVDSCKYLGVIIDSGLKWKDHIDYVHNKLIKYSSIFNKLRNMLPSPCLKSIYFALAHPHILYGIEIYANTRPTYLKPLNVLNNKLLRILQNQRLQNSCSPFILGVPDFTYSPATYTTNIVTSPQFSSSQQ